MTTARDKFLALLRDDLLQLELASLDFGIYRILNYRRREIEDFLDRKLPARIDAALATLPGSPTEDEQGRLFHHLYTFFSRYYDDGDFVTRPRRGREAAYSVPYNGQDVHFWWATKGSHYVKSGERFTSYVWKDGSQAIRIEVAAANVEKDNVKGVKRYYLPEAVEQADGQLTVKLAYRPLDAEEAKRFDRKKPLDDDDGGEAVEGRSAQERILNAWLGSAGRKAKIPTGVDKALLKKHVSRYVAGQTSDFFVHPQLGDFLSSELDWYLKNEFLDIWDRADGEALARERGKLKVVREIGNALIAFLAAIEDVQAQLFEKRKFVLASDWLARVSALPEGKAAQALVAKACANAGQVNEWLAWLGREPLKGRAVANAAKHGEALLTEFPHLCIHTRHFDEGFKLRLLGLFDDIEAATGGTLTHSENYAALRTLEYAYRQQVKCIYIDPPYNAPGTSEIPYKNDFPHASWATLMQGRLRAALSFMEKNAVLIAAIDENEEVTLRQTLSIVRPTAETHSIAVVHNPRGIQGDNFSYSHELAIFSLEKGSKVIGRLSVPKDEWEYSNLRNWGGESERKDGWAMFYPLIIRKGKVVGAGEMLPKNKHPKARVEIYGKDTWIWPIDSKGVERKWRYSNESIKELFGVLQVSGEGTDLEVEIPQLTDAVKTVWKAREYDAGGIYGSKLLKGGLGLTGFQFPKSVRLVARCVLTVRDEKRSLTTLDFFGGSGTTAHAVINLNREDGGTRKFVLVEQGEYFDTVLLPRVAKIIACPEWKDGQPKDGVTMTGNEEHWSHRSPALVNVLRLERYEDSLDALDLPGDAAARRAGQKSFADEPLRYVYEASAGTPSVTLNHERLAKPFDCVIPQTQHGAPVRAKVDVLSTALLLLGLHPLRVREVARKDKTSPRYVFVEARLNGKLKELHLLFLRDCDDRLVGEPLRKHAEAEMHWLDEIIVREFGRKPCDYTAIWYNRDAILSSTNGRSLDLEVTRRMLERAPMERDV